MGICIDCGSYGRVTAGRCQFHYKNYRNKISLERQKEEASDYDSAALHQWFIERIAEFKGECAECGEYINKNVYKYAICAAAHILPKALFPSVALHPDNCMELGATCGCHSRSETWSNAVKMKVWPEMVRKFKIIYPSIALDERRYIPEVLRKEAPEA